MICGRVKTDTGDHEQQAGPYRFQEVDRPDETGYPASAAESHWLHRVRRAVSLFVRSLAGGTRRGERCGTGHETEKAPSYGTVFSIDMEYLHDAPQTAMTGTAQGEVGPARNDQGRAFGPIR